MKKVLIVASVPSMIGQFNMMNIELMQESGYEVHIACNFNDRSVWPEEKIESFKKKMKDMNISFFQVDFSRNVKKLSSHIRAFKQLRVICKENKYEFLHCHTPIGGMLGRFAGMGIKTKVIYTAHGFHFYSGGPILNWLLFYPVEWICSWMTDVLITINKEDYSRAKKHMHAKRVEYVPGIGIDVSKYQTENVDRAAKRKELGIPEEAFVLFSVGELSIRKNHQVVINALKENVDTEVIFIIAGTGELRQTLRELAQRLGIENRVKLLGFREDVAEIFKIADAFIFPSLQEGLPVALMEAMASGVLCIASDIRGNCDLIEDNVNGYLVSNADSDEYRAIIQKVMNLEAGKKEKMISRAQKDIMKFDKAVIKEKMTEIYSNI